MGCTVQDSACRPFEVEGGRSRVKRFSAEILMSESDIRIIPVRRSIRCIYIYTYAYVFIHICIYASPLMYPLLVLELSGIVVVPTNLSNLHYSWSYGKYTKLLICSSMPAPSVVSLLHLPMMLLP